MKTFDEYWPELVGRVYSGKEILEGDEELLYRLTCIMGETLVDGLEAYFDRRYREFDRDMIALKASGFSGLARDFAEAKELMFGTVDMTEEVVRKVVLNLLDERPEDQATLDAIGEVYDRVIPAMDEVAEYRYQLGINSGLYSDIP